MLQAKLAGVITPVLSARDVRVRFGTNWALDGLDFVATPGIISGLLGPNGAGKTTFIRCCTGLVTPDSGSLELFGGRPGSANARARTGLMPQSTGAWSAITPRRLINYLASLYDDPLPTEALSASLGINEFDTTPYRRLSTGQQQLVNLAGSLVGRPSLLFLDEPTAGLDIRGRRKTWDVIRQVRQAGVAIVLTSHDMSEAAELCDEISILDKGRVTTSGTVTELTSAHTLEDVFLANTTGDQA